MARRRLPSAAPLRPAPPALRWDGEWPAHLTHDGLPPAVVVPIPDRTLLAVDTSGGFYPCAVYLDSLSDGCAACAAEQVALCPHLAYRSALEVDPVTGCLTEATVLERRTVLRRARPSTVVSTDDKSTLAVTRLSDRPGGIAYGVGIRGWDEPAPIVVVRRFGSEIPAPDASASPAALPSTLTPICSRCHSAMCALGPLAVSLTGECVPITSDLERTWRAPHRSAVGGYVSSDLDGPKTVVTWTAFTAAKRFRTRVADIVVDRFTLEDGLECPLCVTRPCLHDRLLQPAPEPSRP